ncbi:MAG TPA: hypothetical protein VFL58_03900 [Gaiellaceae bacterium]|nr:hypothetical protein [Gaiellaceae bacterium]
MMWSWRLMTGVALLGVVTALAFPADGSALRAVVIVLTPTGPDPSALTLPVGLYPVWQNGDTSTHAVVFANGLCSFELAPGGFGECPIGLPIGHFAYMVDGTIQASIDVVPEGRSVTLTARSHTIREGGSLRLHGELSVPILSPPVRPAPQPVIVLARPDRYHPFHRIRVVTAVTHGWHLQWQLRVGPRARTIYIVEANSDTQFWQRAWSKSFRVSVHTR